MEKDYIIAKIKDGIIFAYTDAVKFSSCQEDMITREYFYTVYIAKSLYSEAEWGSVKISIEKQTKHFFTDAFPFCNHNNGKLRFLHDHHDSREKSGWIDITVTKNDKSFCAIEVKGINQTKKLLMQDIKRNFEIFDISDDNVGAPTVKFAFLVSLHKYKKMDDVSVSCRIKKLEGRFAGYLRELGGEPRRTRSTVHAFVVCGEGAGDEGSNHLILCNIFATERL